MNQLNALCLGKEPSYHLKPLLEQFFSLKKESELNPPPCHVVFVSYKSLQNPEDLLRVMNTIAKNVHKILIFDTKNITVDFNLMQKWNFDYYLSPPFSIQKIKKLSQSIHKYPKTIEKSSLSSKIDELKNQNTHLKEKMEILKKEISRLQFQNRQKFESLLVIQKDSSEKLKNIQKILNILEGPACSEQYSQQYFQIIENNTKLLKSSMTKISHSLEAHQKHLYLRV